jgi:hypothetical protein
MGRPVHLPVRSQEEVHVWLAAFGLTTYLHSSRR